MEGSEDMRGEGLRKDGRINGLVAVVGMQNFCNQRTGGSELYTVDRVRK